MMKATIYTDLASAVKACTDLDAALGYPKDDGVDIGPGRHVPHVLSTTQRYTAPVKHPTLEQWAVPLGLASDVVKPEFTVVTSKAAVVDLDATWTPADATAVVDAPIEEKLP